MIEKFDNKDIKKIHFSKQMELCKRSNKEQTNELLKHLQSITYLKAKDICKYVKETCGIEYSIPGMIAWVLRQIRYLFMFERVARARSEEERALKLTLTIYRRASS